MNLLQRMKEIKGKITVKVKHGSNIYKHRKQQNEYTR